MQEEVAGQSTEEELPENVVHMNPEKGIVTTRRMEAYYIVKGILGGLVKPDRIVHRDVKTYFNVLLDDNNRKRQH